MNQKKYSQYLNHEDYEDGSPHDDNNHSNINHSHHHHDHSHHGHDHAAMIRDASSKVLFWCLILTFSFSLIEAIGGYFASSIALQSDAVHMLTDAVGLFIAYLANQISKKPATVNLTFGYGKAEAIGALINCIFTMFLTCGLLIEIIFRFWQPVVVHGVSLFVIASIGFLVNGVIAFVLSKHSESLNTKAALIHTMGDLLASAIAIAAGVIIYFTNFWRIDPILSLVVVLLLIISNFKLIKKSIVVLMAGVPENLSYEEIGHDLEQIDNVVSVHDLHIWYMSANKTALSAHIVIKNNYLWPETLDACQTMLMKSHQIEHITLQYEFDPHKVGLNYCEVV